MDEASNATRRWWEITPQNIEQFADCQKLLDLAKKRKRHLLKHDEYVRLLANYRNHHFPQEASTLGHLSKMGFSKHLHKLVQPVLDAYLLDQNIIVLPQEKPEPIHPYSAGGLSGMARVTAVQRKATLARKLREMKK